MHLNKVIFLILNLCIMSTHCTLALFNSTERYIVLHRPFSVECFCLLLRPFLPFRKKEKLNYLNVVFLVFPFFNL